MCKVSDKLKLCTCSSSNARSLKHYWILHRFDDTKDIQVIGVIMMPDWIERGVDLYNSKLLLKLLNEPSTFDVDISPRQKDRLELRFSFGEKKISYGFQYNNGKWKEKNYDAFKWEWHYNKDLSGKIKNAVSPSK